MQPPIRKQHDKKQPKISQETGIDFSGLKIITRQEDKLDADINHLLGRFGVGLPVKQPEWGKTIDYSLDLQTAMGAIDEAKQAFQDLPDNLREKYRTWQNFLNAIESGRLVINNSEDPETIKSKRVQEELDVDNAREELNKARRVKRAADAALREEDITPKKD